MTTVYMPGARKCDICGKNRDEHYPLDKDGLFIRSYSEAVRYACPRPLWVPLGDGKVAFNASEALLDPLTERIGKPLSHMGFSIGKSCVSWTNCGDPYMRSIWASVLRNGSTFTLREITIGGIGENPSAAQFTRSPIILTIVAKMLTVIMANVTRDGKPLTFIAEQIDVYHDYNSLTSHDYIVPLYLAATSSSGRAVEHDDKTGEIKSRIIAGNRVSFTRNQDGYRLLVTDRTVHLNYEMEKYLSFPEDAVRQ